MLVFVLIVPTEFLLSFNYLSPLASWSTETHFHALIPELPPILIAASPGVHWDPHRSWWIGLHTICHHFCPYQSQAWWLKTFKMWGKGGALESPDQRLSNCFQSVMANCPAPPLYGMSEGKRVGEREEERGHQNSTSRVRTGDGRDGRKLDQSGNSPASGHPEPPDILFKARFWFHRTVKSRSPHLKPAPIWRQATGPHITHCMTMKMISKAPIALRWGAGGGTDLKMLREEILIQVTHFPK